MFANSDYTQPVNAKRDRSIPVAWRKPAQLTKLLQMFVIR
ncbi:MAG: hypothetical protein RLZZ441_976 [Actinomycetota bacterium]|jgi:hypothetical protein